MITPAPFKSHLPSRGKHQQAFFFSFLAASPLIAYALHLAHLPMGDFTTILSPAARDIFHPYSIEGYINPPWAALLLAPLSLLPSELGRVLVSLLNMLTTGLVVLKYGGRKAALLITFTSYPFLFLLSTGSIEWMPMLGLLLNVPLLILAKPQSGVFVLLVWFRRTKNKLAFIFIIAACIGLSLLIWPGWHVLMLENIRTLPARLASPLNKIDLWPWGIPFGLIVLYFALMQEDEALAALATWLLVPHLVYHSLTMGMALLAVRYPRLALIVSMALYAVVWVRWHSG